MRGDFSSRPALFAILGLILLLSVSSQATELFAVGRLTAEYYNGDEWTQLYPPRDFYEQNILMGVWGASDDDIFTVGANGAIAHYDGSAWNDMTSGVTVQLESVWGSSPSAVFAVGSEGTILHYDGAEWDTMSSGTENQLYDVWGASDTDVYAVGDSIILHYDGIGWEKLRIGPTGVYRSVWVSPSGETFISRDDDILHYNGTKWETLHNPEAVTINDIWGISANDVFFACDEAIVLRYKDGSFSSTTVSSSTYDLRAITGISDSLLYVLSDYSSYRLDEYGSWVQILGASQCDLQDICAVSNNLIVAVGERDYATDMVAVILQKNEGNSRWSSMMLDSFPYPSHVWGCSSDDVFIAGTLDYIGVIWHWDGSEWANTPVPSSNRITDIWGTSGDNVFAINIAGAYETASILHYDGSAWSVMAELGWTNLWDIWGNSDSDIYVVSGGGPIYHYDGMVWSEIAVTPFPGAESIYASPEGEIFVAGSYQVSYYYWVAFAAYYDGSEWTAWDDFGACNEDFNAVWGSSKENIYFTIGKCIYHYNGQTGELVDIESPESLFYEATDIWGDSEGNLFVTNRTPNIYLYDGDDWSTMYTGNYEDIIQIYGWDDSMTDVIEPPRISPALSQNYPNPFNPVTTIRFDLQQAAHVNLCIYNVRGELVAVLVDRHMTEGSKELSWAGKDLNGKKVSSGVYFYRLVAGDFVQARKMVLLR